MGWWGVGVVGNLAEISPSPYPPKSLSTAFRLSSQKKAILYPI
ncbi:MAG: indole-3-glycerol-phosphate synthase [Microcystis viridis Mv_BB_P_19951000_S69]|uniref:Indole-3-glycerol-phosphate synthase n=1 Tax=Microcystis viridis Mv_BB_P_19951000_S68D TaxID=2486270 RepID=A0A552I2C7_MICVR|nr:MAG: indole-3-glycerol-phosphate synthase [Microcystis viridis Mv_BB_P_19951000_S69]TRU77587.1 MAG: indole-3-glycerol-phosphate synthase [Microcystis viridis Mv_BB_P_19951000_S68D]TRU78331.1 MAG: indole-3-glycerol-phosphate synthase [Microcystis viridis Mv_BB_P_19951000_S68]TRU83715.1 MAG: indole-3-glycerol-phosphate synthase [Microcystis viridis Mv_BB_P_19951000_S69D]